MNMKKKAPAKTSGRSKKAVADLSPRNTADLKGGAKSQTKDAIIQNIRG